MTSAWTIWLSLSPGILLNKNLISVIHRTTLLKVRRDNKQVTKSQNDDEAVEDPAKMMPMQSVDDASTAAKDTILITLCIIVRIIMAIRATESRTKMMANFDSVVKNSIVMTLSMMTTTSMMRKFRKAVDNFIHIFFFNCT